MAAIVTSPNGAADGDYPLTVSVQRVGASGTSGSATSYYKVYSSDDQAPTLFWPSPEDGATITGRSDAFTVSSNDDHAVRQIDLSIDGLHVSTAQCDGVSYTCQLYYMWSARRASGRHTAKFSSHDWMGNLLELIVSFQTT